MTKVERNIVDLDFLEDSFVIEFPPCRTFHPLLRLQKVCSLQVSIVVKNMVSVVRKILPGHWKKSKDIFNEKCTNQRCIVLPERIMSLL